MAVYDKFGKPIKSGRTVSEVDKNGARELALFAENTLEIYNGVLTSVLTNLQRKAKKGIYDKNKAVVAWLHVINEAAKLYDNWYGSGRDSLQLFNKATRMEAARQLMNRMDEDVFRDVEIDSSRKPIKSVYDNNSFEQVENAANEIRQRLTSYGIKVEDYYDDYFEDVRCMVLSTENLNPMLISDLNSIIQDYMAEHPEIAIENETNDYFYGRNIYIMLSDEYYIDSSRKPIKSSLENSNDKTLFSKSLNQLSNENVLKVDFKVLGVHYVLMLNTPNSMHENEIIIVNRDTGAIDIVQKEDYDLPLYQLMSQDFLIDFEPTDTEITKVDYNKIESSKKRKHKTADERAKDEGADITCSRKPIKSSFNYYDGFENDVAFFAERYSDNDDIVEMVAGDIENDHPTESPEEFDSLMRAVQEELKRQGYFKQPWQVNNSRQIKSSKEDKADEDGPHMKFKTLDEDTKFRLREQIEDELEALLDKLHVKFTTDVWEETVQYILSFFEEDNAYNPRTAKQAVHEWYLDTKDDFPEMFDNKKQKVASARYCEWIRSKRLIKSAKKFFK